MTQVDPFLARMRTALQGILSPGGPKHPLERAGTELLEMLAMLPELVMRLEKDADVRERVRVYKDLASVVSKELELPAIVAFLAVMEVVDERDIDVREAVCGPHRPEALDAATIRRTRGLLLSATVTYQTENRRQVSAELGVYFLRGGKPVRTTVTEKLSWEDVPSDVRLSAIRDGETSFQFKILPKEV